jgi:hypothetical protein
MASIVSLCRIIVVAVASLATTGQGVIQHDQIRSKIIEISGTRAACQVTIPSEFFLGAGYSID